VRTRRIHLELHEKRLKVLKGRIKDEARADEDEDEDMQRLQAIAGMGPIVAYAFLATSGTGSVSAAGRTSSGSSPGLIILGPSSGMGI